MRYLLALALSGCTFLIVRPNVTNGNGGGGGGGGGPACPVVATQTTPTADVFVFARMSGQTAALAPYIADLLSDVASNIGSRKVTIAHTLIAPLVEEPSVPGPFYFDSCSAPAPQSVASTLQYFAAPVTAPNLSAIEHQEAATIGVDLTTLIPSYPADFLGGSDAPPGAPFFDTPPTYALVIFVDSLARKNPFDTSEVSGQPVATYFKATSSDKLNWLAYGAEHLAADHVFYLSVATSEFSESVAAMDKRCLADPGFPENTLDFLQPSGAEYFTAFNSSINATFHQRSAFIDFCDALSSTESSRISSEIKTIHSNLGLPQ